jgi:hypothetical protein
MDIPSPFRQPSTPPEPRRINPVPPEGNPSRLPPVLVLETTSNALKPGHVYQTASVEMTRCENGPGGYRLTGVTVYGENGQMVYLANGRWEWAPEETISRHLGAVHAALDRIEKGGALADDWGFASPALRSLRDQIKNLDRLARPLAFPMYEARYAPHATKPTIHNASLVLARLRGALQAAAYFAGQGTVRDASLACYAIQKVISEVEADLAGAPTDLPPAADHHALINDVMPTVERLHKALGLKPGLRAGEVLKAALTRLQDNETRIQRDTAALMRVTEDRDRLERKVRETTAQAESVARIVQVPLESLLGGRLVPLPFDVLAGVAEALRYYSVSNDKGEIAKAARARLGQFFKGAKDPIKETPR